MSAPLTHASLFTGLGGFNEGAARAGIPTIWTCEANPWLRARLKNHYPTITHYEDVTTLCAQAPERANILSGGFPCQDISRALTKAKGGQKGLEGSRSGLWYAYHAAIGHLRPDYAIVENVADLYRNGLAAILANLAQIGYNAEWTHIRASWFGLGHQRTRTILIAYPNSIGQPLFLGKRQGEIEALYEQSYAQAGALPQLAGLEQVRNYIALRNDDGLGDWTNRIKAIGNAFPIPCAHFLFEIIKNHHQQ